MSSALSGTIGPILEFSQFTQTEEERFREIVAKAKSILMPVYFRANRSLECYIYLRFLSVIALLKCQCTPEAVCHLAADTCQRVAGG